MHFRLDPARIFRNTEHINQPGAKPERKKEFIRGAARAIVRVVMPSGLNWLSSH